MTGWPYILQLTIVVSLALFIVIWLLVILPWLYDGPM